MTQEPALESAPARVVSSLSFDEIPGQSRLFLDYLKDPLSLKKYYPNAVSSPLDIGGHRDAVLDSYATDRDQLCDALVGVNAQADQAVLRNIDLLRQAETVAVVTGQQAGLFTGPLYTIYKALSAIKLSEGLQRSGVNAVPVFWVASEDHDLDEIDHAEILERNDGFASLTYRPKTFTEGVSVGDIIFDDGIAAAVNDLMSEMPQTEFSGGIRRMISKANSAGDTYGTSFTKLVLALLGKYGLIVIDPLNETIKRLASPIYVAAIERSDEVVAAIRARNAELESAGYSPQVLVEEDYFPLFWHDQDGRRLALKRADDGVFRVKGGKLEFRRDELLSMAREEPHRFSPGVMLRPVVQDYLLPTLCYFGGGAEISYFAQNAETYRVLDRPATPIFHRQSFTVVEPRERRNLERFGWGLKTLFRGKDAAVVDAAEHKLAPDLARLFDDVEERVRGEIDRLDASLKQSDPTIAASLAKRREKIEYHIETLREKSLRSEVRKDETMRRRIDNVFDSLLPDGVLQERHLNVVIFLNKYGPSFIDWIYDAIDLSDKGHRIVEI